MNSNKRNDSPGVMKSLFMVYLILGGHLLLIVALCFFVLFFRGLVNYLPWIFMGGVSLVALSAFLIYKRMKTEGKALKEILSLPMLQGKTVEISILGGLASVRVEDPHPQQPMAIANDTGNQGRPIHALPPSSHVTELLELAHLLDNNLITMDEYNKAKKKVIN
ncbi:hypothetical protein [Desulfoluna sp.]|uniref:hypothetical protein n=1 Tax=Desulfoluna sp. TaxID=2045199 RepID=UPI002628D139|nr:hypothetical protein [Desulfoluna sp.]